MSVVNISAFGRHRWDTWMSVRVLPQTYAAGTFAEMLDYIKSGAMREQMQRNWFNKHSAVWQVDGTFMFVPTGETHSIDDTVAILGTLSQGDAHADVYQRVSTRDFDRPRLLYPHRPLLEVDLRVDKIYARFLPPARYENAMFMHTH